MNNSRFTNSMITPHYLCIICQVNGLWSVGGDSGCLNEFNFMKDDTCLYFGIGNPLK